MTSFEIANIQQTEGKTKYTSVVVVVVVVVLVVDVVVLIAVAVAVVVVNTMENHIFVRRFTIISHILF